MRSQQAPTIQNWEVVNDFLVIAWTDGSESYLPLQRMRDNCPCANCAGETDVLGNIYKGPPQKMTPASYQLRGIIPVGHYGIRPAWVDGHTDGIYNFELIQGLAAEE